MNLLSELNLISIIQELGELETPLLGICLGMQLLYDVGFENGETKGLGLISGVVNKISVKTERLPHLGWNNLEIINENSSCAKQNGYW